VGVIPLDLDRTHLLPNGNMVFQSILHVDNCPALGLGGIERLVETAGYDANQISQLAFMTNLEDPSAPPANFSARNGPPPGPRKLKRKRPIDQRNKRARRRPPQIRRWQILRKFGEFSHGKRTGVRTDDVTPLIHRHFLTDRRNLSRWPASCDVNQDARSSISGGDPAFAMQIVVLSLLKEKVMRQVVISLLLVGSFVALSTMEASAVVCARGAHRAGRVGAGGAVAVRPVAGAVVVAPRPVVVAPRGGVVRRRVY
jgi:hypothetical protein